MLSNFPLLGLFCSEYQLASEMWPLAKLGHSLEEMAAQEGKSWKVLESVHLEMEEGRQLVFLCVNRDLILETHVTYAVA